MSQDIRTRPIFQIPPTLGDTLFQAAERLHRDSEKWTGSQGRLTVPQCLAIAGCHDAAAQAYMHEDRDEDRVLAEAQAEQYRASARWMTEDLVRKHGRDAIDPRWRRWHEALATARPAPLPASVAA